MSAWPPLWANVSPSRDATTVRGEVGILKDCSYSERVKNMCFLFIEHSDERYAGALVVDDPGLCRQLYGVLKQHIGRSIKEIGGLDLSRSLWSLALYSLG